MTTKNYSIVFSWDKGVHTFVLFLYQLETFVYKANIYLEIDMGLR